MIIFELYAYVLVTNFFLDLVIFVSYFSYYIIPLVPSHCWLSDRIIIKVYPSKHFVKLRRQLLSYTAHRRTHKSTNITSLVEVKRLSHSVHHIRVCLMLTSLTFGLYGTLAGSTCTAY